MVHISNISNATAQLGRRAAIINADKQRLFAAGRAELTDHLRLRHVVRIARGVKAVLRGEGLLGGRGRIRLVRRTEGLVHGGRIRLLWLRRGRIRLLLRGVGAGVVVGIGRLRGVGIVAGGRIRLLRRVGLIGTRKTDVAWNGFVVAMVRGVIGSDASEVGGVESSVWKNARVRHVGATRGKVVGWMEG